MTRRVLKSDVVAEIAGLIGVDVPAMSTGSTEPRAIFDSVNERLGLGIDPGLTKEAMARAIVECTGAAWHPEFESRGATVTLPGLFAVRDAVRFLLK